MEEEPVEQPQQPGRVPSRKEQDARDFELALRAVTPRLWVMPALIAINVLVYAAMVAQGVHWKDPSSGDLLAWGANFGPATLGGEWSRLLTSTFVHIGLLHLALNMWVLFDLALLVERLVGNVGFLVLYLLSGVFASVMSLAWDGDVVSAGASGAIFGVFGVLIAVVWRAPGKIPRTRLDELRSSSFMFLGFNLLFGLAVPNIDMAAHLGGLGAGALIGLGLSHTDMLSDRRPRGRRNGLVCAAGIAVVVIGSAAVPRDLAEAEHELALIAEAEGACIQAQRAAAERVEIGEIDQDEYLSILERDVVQPWREACARLTVFEAVPDSMQELFDQMERYARLREEVWSLQVRALREDDLASMSEFMAKSAELERFVDEVGWGYEDP